MNYFNHNIFLSHAFRQILTSYDSLTRPSDLRNLKGVYNEN